jgi:hypothetical protein
MNTTDRDALRATLARMRILHEELADHPTDAAVLRLDAAVTALESRLWRNGVPRPGDRRNGLYRQQVAP